MATPRKLRTLEQVLSVLEDAKIKEDDLLNVSQPLYFAGNLDNQDTYLMELEPELLEYLQEGNSLVLRGNKQDPAILCTDTRTFEVKEATTSNSLLLLSKCYFPKDEIEHSEERILLTQEASGVFHKYFELRKCHPKVRKLFKLLAENIYNGPENEKDEDHQGQKYAFSDLLNYVQASEEEIKTALQNMKACEIEGFWRILDFDYLSRVVCRVLSLIEENSWTIDHIPLKETLDTLQDLEPRCVLKHCLQYYADRKQSDSGEVIYRLNEDKICQLFAEMLLRPAGKFNLQEFLESWQQSVPEGMKVSLMQVQGLALIDYKSHPPIIWYFPAFDLPENIFDRFNLLFKTREKWTFEDIKPYIQDLTTETLNEGALLTKYAKSSLVNGIKMYNSKRPLY